MKPAATILHLLHKEIDKQQWDACILQSDASIIYAQSFYLDAVAPKWSALVAADYSWVLPLTHRKKFTIFYLYQPPFTQQLGVFAKPGVDIPWNAIVQNIKTKYSYWEINWNYFPATISDADININPATNFVLNLTTPYQAIIEKYSKDLQRNLKRSNRFNFIYEATPGFEKSINLYRTYYGDRIKHVTDANYAAFRTICLHAEKQKLIYCRQVKNQQHEVLAMALLLSDGKRLYNMMNTTTPAGRKTEANHFLLDRIIHEFSGSNMVFDFEGSDLPGVKAFYENFSPVNVPYFSLRYNDLPAPLKWLKK